jgi:hypothetical protein
MNMPASGNDPQTRQWHPAAERLVQDFQVLQHHEDLACMVNEIISTCSTPALRDEMVNIIRQRLGKLPPPRIQDASSERRVQRRARMRRLKALIAVWRHLTKPHP